MGLVVTIVLFGIIFYILRKTKNVFSKIITFIIITFLLAGILAILKG